MRWDLGFMVVGYVGFAFVALWMVDRIPGRRAGRGPRPDAPARRSAR